MGEGLGMGLRRLAATAAISAAALTMAAAPAFAHVTVNPSEASQGGFEKLTFRVPNEEDAADTVKVEVKFPTDTPIPSVSVKPHPGWTVDVKKDPLATPLTTDDGTVTEAVSLITWSGGKIGPGEFDEFEVSVGPLPEVDSLKFPTVQTYSDGNVVSWIQDTPAGGPEPDRPAPVLTLTAAAAGSDHHGSDSSSSAASTSSSSTPTVNGTAATVVKKETDNGLAIAGLGVAGVALVLGAIALFRPRKSTPAG
jgi:uncharacterized protein YcnI